MSFQLFCVLLGSCLVASVYGADVDATTEGRDTKCFLCLMKCVFNLPHLKEFALCLKNCVIGLPSDARDVRDGRLPIHSSKRSGAGYPGQYEPQYDADGKLSPLQFNPSTGYSWCVDEDGLVVEGTLTPPGHPAPDCGGDGKGAGVVTNGGECVSCAIGCAQSGKCHSIVKPKCWWCVLKCLAPGKSEKIQESESVEEEEEDDASGEKPSNTSWPWLQPTTTKPKPPPEASEDQGDQEKSEDSAEITHRPTPVTFTPKTGKPFVLPTTTKPKPPPESSEDQGDQEKSEDSAEFTHPPTHVTFTRKTFKPFVLTTTAQPKPPPESSEDQGDQEKSEDSAELTHPPTHVTLKPLIKPTTKPAEPAESSAELSEPLQDQDDY